MTFKTIQFSNTERVREGRMSQKSVPKLKTDFLHLYKGIYNNITKNKQATPSKNGPSLTTKNISNMRTSDGMPDTKPSPNKGTDSAKNINSLFRSTGKMDETKADAPLTPSTAHPAPRTKTSQEDRREPTSHTLLTHKNLSKGSISRGSSAGSKKKNNSHVDMFEGLAPYPTFKRVSALNSKVMPGYKSLAANYPNMFGVKKDREASKNSRSSQRRPSSNTGSSPKNTAVKPQLGKQTLNKLLQQHPSTSAKLVLGPGLESKASGFLNSTSKRKNSSTSSLHRNHADSRPSIANKSTSKVLMRTPSNGIGSQIHYKHGSDPKKEILKTRLNLDDVKKKKEDGKVSPKTAQGNTSGHGAAITGMGGLSNFVTQVHKAPIPTPSPDSAVDRQTIKSAKKKKKIVTAGAESGILFSMKCSGQFYMEKLELSFKKCGNDEESQLFRQHFQVTIQNLSLLGKASTWVDPVEETAKSPMPPLRNPKMKTIVFDLDETLIHCNENQEDPCDVRVPVTFPSGESIDAGINIRPFAKVILEELSRHFEIVVFTASHSCYGNPVINFLDPEGKYISRRFFRDSCREISEGLFVKDLTIMKNRHLKNLILVDNAAYSYCLQLDNGIPIIPFYSNKKDTELRELANFLIGLAEAEDVRPILKNTFRNHFIAEHSKNIEVLFKKLFGI